MLGPKLQKKWHLKSCVANPENLSYIPMAIPFMSWAHVLQGEMESSLPDPVASMEDPSTYLKAFIGKQLKHPGSFFNLPWNVKIWSPIRFDSLSLEQRIAARVAIEITSAEMRKVIQRVEKDFEENGLEALCRYYDPAKIMQWIYFKFLISNQKIYSVILHDWIVAPMDW